MRFKNSDKDPISFETGIDAANLPQNIETAENSDPNENEYHGDDLQDEQISNDNKVIRKLNTLHKQLLSKQSFFAADLVSATIEKIKLKNGE